MKGGTTLIFFEWGISMTYQEWLREYAKRIQEPKYQEEHHQGVIFCGDKPIEVDLVIRKQTSQKLLPL